MKYSVSFYPTIVLFAALSLFAIGCSNSGENNSAPDSRTESTSPAAPSDSSKYVSAPDFTLETMDGDSLTLSNHRGKIIVLNFWATWCPPCREEIPDFMELQQQMREDVLFIGVSVDQDGWQAVRPYAKKMDINYPITVDNGRVSRQYGPFRGIPTTFIINRKGNVERVAPGRIPKKRLQSALSDMINRK